MAKLNLTRVFDSGRVIQSFSQAGISDLEDFITYLYDFSNQVIGALRGTLTIGENLNSLEKTIDLKNGIVQQITLPDQKKIPRHVWISKVIPFNNAPLSFSWQMAQNGTMEVKATFTGAPTGSTSVSLIILF